MPEGLIPAGTGYSISGSTFLSAHCPVGCGPGIQELDYWIESRNLGWSEWGPAFGEKSYHSSGPEARLELFSQILNARTEHLWREFRIVHKTFFYNEGKLGVERITYPFEVKERLVRAIVEPMSMFLSVRVQDQKLDVLRIRDNSVIVEDGMCSDVLDRLYALLGGNTMSAFEILHKVSERGQHPGQVSK
jgi:hypothetical protein